MPSSKSSGQTIYLPKSQRLSPPGLLRVFERIACQAELRYAA
ncbi:MAG: hypothetical protein AAGF11_25480 [Myxococcota bacterium]